MTNPFDDDRREFLALANPAGEYSLWPASAPPPAGWRVAHGPDSRAECLAHVERHWHDLGPAPRGHRTPTH